MNELADFLLARIAEDQHRADCAGREVPQQRSNGEVWGVWIGDKWYQSTAFAAHTAAYSPARVLAECDAKRRIVRNYQAWAATPGDNASQGAGALRWVLQALALPYADHSDYRDEWRP